MACLDRMKTICVLSGTPYEIADNIKDLIYNGYGVVLFTNVGFPDVRDSQGISYPDRNWYHTYSIIGYDDRKYEYQDCVYLLSNSWGNWNAGGHPSWGPIPNGSFLVTGAHLTCMLRFNQATDFLGCRRTNCPEPCNAADVIFHSSCTEENSCVPFECSIHQKAFGLAVALSTQDGFPKRDLNYKQFYPVQNMRVEDSAEELSIRQP